ncbi:parallel beta-helix repeat (two copies) [Xenococcus sp. PCC 7305]|uniref:DUF1565 domain-containing protein n=1 Tax=Xenococcus sp. PCC 7305 TaxID=102125 RepID=UPI0002AC788A|nr:DUF1565 domain-containing protein [Xenococcus sp. PCC 7305]ELS02513.1 parallel beta-helix repeat (two copies) [Xenococcus sp. PCC 7305]
MLRLSIQSKDISSFNTQKLALIFGTIMPLSWSLFSCPNVALAQETGNSNYLKQEVADVAKNIIYVNPHQGNDDAVGNRNSPLKTITQALRIAPTNTVISLVSGTYSEETGETFPLIMRKNITLQGTVESQGSNILVKGGGDFISPTGAGQNVAIALIRDAGTITGITVTNPNRRGHGIWIESANPTITSSSLIGNGNTGISVNGKSQPTIEDNYFFNNLGNGLLVYGSSHPQVKNNLFERTGFGVGIVKNAAVTLQGNSFKGNRIGVIFEGNSQGVLRDNKILGSQEYGLVAIANSRVDLGTNEQSGGNVFRGSGKFDIQNITKNSIVAVGTEVYGATSGTIDFEGNTNSLVAINSTVTREPEPENSSLRDQPLTPLPARPTNNDLPQRRTASSSAITSSETLPLPPSITNPNSLANENNLARNDNGNAIANVTPRPLDNGTKELVFSAPTSDVIENNATANVISFVSPVATIKYRVLVETANSSQQSQVRSLYPDAFRTVYQGKTMLQVGAFSQRSKAETASRSLVNMGLNPYILE